MIEGYKYGNFPTVESPINTGVNVCASCGVWDKVVCQAQEYDSFSSGHKTLLGHFADCKWALQRYEELYPAPYARPFTKPSTAQRALEL